MAGPSAAGGPALWAGAVAVEDERLLLARRPSPPDTGRWTLPAAEVAIGEPLAACVVRAVGEVAGLEAVCEGLLGHLEQLGGGSHRVLLAFSATLLGDGVLVAGSSWVHLDDVAALPLVDGLAELLADHGILRLIV